MNRIKWLHILLLISFCIYQKTYTQDQNQKSLEVDLNNCIELALKNNSLRSVSMHAVESAGYKVKQAQSGHYPQVSLSSALTITDEDPNYIAPPMSIKIDQMTLGTFSIPSLEIGVPAQTIKMADNLNFQAQVDLVFPLFTGGKISALVEQAQAGLEIAKQDARSNNEKIIYETKRLYYAVLLSTKLEEIANDTYERLRSTLDFTESLYQKGSARVTRIEYLKNKSMVEAINSILIGIQGEKKVAYAALVNAMGLEWNTTLVIKNFEIPFNKTNDSLEDLVEQLIQTNPYIAKINSGLTAYENKIKEAKSNLYPSVALIGMYRRTVNNYDYGIETKENKNMWVAGLGLSMNLFDGLRTFAKIDEEKSNYNHIAAQKELAKKGLILKLQYLFHKIKSDEQKEISSQLAMSTSSENRELIENAYRSDIKELEDVLQAHISEAVMNAQYQMLRFEHADFEAQLVELLASSPANSVNTQN